MTPDTTTYTSAIISQEQFDQYTAKWLSVVSSGDSELAHAFSAPGVERLLALTFPIERIKWLVSAVGVRQVKARFLLVPDKSGRQHFSIALFATDTTGERLSAYYVPNAYWEGSASSATVGDPIPADLATTWLANWKAAPEITPALFATPPGPLEGYNFEVQDFVSTLFNAQPFQSPAAYLGLGLHEYHAPNAEGDALTHTFGLVLQLDSPEQARMKDQADSYFDMSFPCPPNT